MCRFSLLKYINLENMEAHVVKSPGGDVLSKVKAMKETPSKRPMLLYSRTYRL